MITLSRNRGESLRIGDNIIITITGINKIDERVNVSIDAPKDLSVCRDEKYHELKNELKELREEKNKI